MVDWRTIKKIDAHIHILPDCVHDANPDSEDVWVYADLHKYRAVMDRLGIEKAVIMSEGETLTLQDLQMSISLPDNSPSGISPMSLGGVGAS